VLKIPGLRRILTFSPVAICPLEPVAVLRHQLRRCEVASWPAFGWRRLAVVALLVPLACGSATDAAPPASAAVRVELTTTLPRLDRARDGSYEAWLVDAGGARHSLGRFDAGGALALTSRVAGARAVEVTLEPPGDVDATPASQQLLRGTLRGGRAELGYAGAVTQNDLALNDAPGQFTMFTPSDNAVLGYPSREEAGVWLFNMSPGETVQKDYYVRLTQLQRGWTYEGWMVRDIAQAGAIWLSYGKFLPDWTGALNQADDTGWGPFSGVVDFTRARLEDYPGDDWVANPLGLPLPAGLTLPLNLRERDAQGVLRWTHAITIEPASDRGEPLTSERPSIMRPYVDLFGDRAPGVARKLTRRPEGVPRGTVVVR